MKYQLEYISMTFNMLYIVMESEREIIWCDKFITISKLQEKLWYCLERKGETANLIQKFYERHVTLLEYLLEHYDDIVLEAKVLLVKNML